MANLPTISESNVSKKSPLEKVLPVMAKDISIMKTSLIKFMKNQTSQQTKAENYFRTAKKKEDLYESKYSKKSITSSKTSSSPTRSGGTGVGLFDSKVGFFEFLKRIFNVLSKGLLVGGAVFGLKKLLENEGIRKSIGDFLKNVFVGFLELVRDGANIFKKMLDENGPEIQKVLTETFVAIMGVIESSIRSITNLLTGPDSDKIYKAIGEVFSAIGDAIVKVFTTKIDIKGFEVPLGAAAIGLWGLIKVIGGFGLALQRATAAALGFGATAGKGAGGAIGGIFSLIRSGIYYAIGAAIAAYVGAEAYNAWKKKNPDLDESGQPIDPKSQLNDRSIPGAYDQQTGYLDSGKIAVGAAEATGGLVAGYGAYKMIKAGGSMRTVPSVPVSPGSPTPTSGFPRGSAPTITTAALPASESKIITQRAGSGPRDYERMRSMGQAAEGMYAGKRGPLPPKDVSMLEKVMSGIKKLYAKGVSVGIRFIEFVTPKIAARLGWSVAGKAAGAITAIGAGAAVMATGFGVAAGYALTTLGWALIAADVYFLYSLIQDFMKSEGISDTSPTRSSSGTVDYSPDFRDQMVQGANRSREESIDTGDARAMAENYLGRPMSDKEWSELVRATSAEGSGKSTEEYAYIMAAILNRSRSKGGKDISQILREPNQFEAVTGGKNPKWNSGKVSQKDYDMITSGTAILGSIGHNLDSFGSSNLSAYGNKETGKKHLANLLNSGGFALGGSTFGYGLYTGVRPSMNTTSGELRNDSRRMNDMERLRKEAEQDLDRGKIVNIIGSFNTETSKGKPEAAPSAPVATPWNEEMFFENMAKSVFG
jgi:hypothetical protein